MSEKAAPPGIDRRRVLQGAAWATPAVLIATAVPAAANSPSVGALESTAIISVVRGSKGNIDIATVGISVPQGIVLTGVTLVVTWLDRGNNGGVTPTSSMMGFTPASSDAIPASFTGAGTLSGSGTLVVEIEKGAARTGDDFVITLSGYVQGTSTLASVSVGGNYPGA